MNFYEDPTFGLVKKEDIGIPQNQICSPHQFGIYPHLAVPQNLYQSPSYQIPVGLASQMNPYLAFQGSSQLSFLHQHQLGLSGLGPYNFIQQGTNDLRDQQCQDGRMQIISNLEKPEEKAKRSGKTRSTLKTNQCLQETKMSQDPPENLYKESFSINNQQSMGKCFQDQDSSQLKPPTKKRVLEDFELAYEIQMMIKFVINNLSFIPPDEVYKQYKKRIPQCQQRKILKDLLLKLWTRYLQANKTNEEMIKYIVRKSMKSQRVPSKKKLGEQLEEYNYIQEDSEAQELGITNGEMKKMNSSFLKKLFASIQYQQDYQVFLDRYENLINEDNETKIRKYVDFLVKIVQTNQLEKTHEYNRFPWLKKWIQESIEAAQELKSKYVDCKGKSKKLTKQSKRLQKQVKTNYD